MRRITHATALPAARSGRSPPGRRSRARTSSGTRRAARVAVVAGMMLTGCVSSPRASHPATVSFTGVVEEVVEISSSELCPWAQQFEAECVPYLIKMAGRDIPPALRECATIAMWEKDENGHILSSWPKTFINLRNYKSRLNLVRDHNSGCRYFLVDASW